MKLLLKNTCESITVYREKWGVVLYIATMSVVCLLMPVWFYLKVGSAQTGLSYGFIIVFCLVFLWAGCAALVNLPGQAKQYFREEGAPVLFADKSGVTVTSALGAKPEFQLWDNIEQIVLIDRVQLLEPGETNYLRRAILVFLMPSVTVPMRKLGPLQVSSIPKSGKGRLYLASVYPNGKEYEVQAALRGLAPRTVPVDVHVQARFDFKKGIDSYGGF